MKTVLVTGGKGQLAQCLKDLCFNFTGFKFIFVDVDELDITNKSEVNRLFSTKKISYCINCAAFTAVDKAESENEMAFRINTEGAKILALACKDYHATLIHISTDFVFDGKANNPYKEMDKANPLSVYGESKLKGELSIIDNLDNYFIIRTSWLYSEYGHNFLKTMLRLAENRKDISVVSDQLGSPTYARDLAKFMIKIISEENKDFGIYHYSNEGKATWYDFAKSIFSKTNKEVNLKPISTKDYPTPATRPKFSLLDKTKVKNVFNITIPEWNDSLDDCLKRLNQKV